MRKTLQLSFLLGSLISTFIHAREKPSEPQIRILLLAPAGTTIEIHTMAADTKKLTGPILVGARGVSDPVTPGERMFFLVLPDKTSESGYRSVSEVTLPAAGNDFIILLEPTGESFKSHLVSGNEPRFQNDSTLFFNTTDAQVGVKFGEDEIAIPPHTPVFAEAPRISERPWYQVNLYETKEDGSRLVFANTRWPHRKSSRCYLFLYRSESNGRVSYQTVDESVAPVEK